VATFKNSPEVQWFKTLKRGQVVDIVCRSGGTIGITLNLSDCKFISQYVADKTGDIAIRYVDILNGKINVGADEKNAVISLLTTAKNVAPKLPKDSPCFRLYYGDECKAQLSQIEGAGLTP